MVGTRDLARAAHFYDRIFEEMGLERCYSDDQVASWGDKTDDAVPRFFTCKPFDGEVASVGNGTMIAFLVPEPVRIKRLYDIVMQHGGGDADHNGAPSRTWVTRPVRTLDDPVLEPSGSPTMLRTA
jgi:catechol 2,3-dioxygenase-like lactoylglutathione lyase family enzyme